MNSFSHEVVDRIAAAVSEKARRRPFIVAIAGPPGAGKSTLATLMERKLTDDGVQSCAIVAMDGYHYDNEIIEPLGLLSRKGAPETFNAAGLVRDIVNIRGGRETAVPVFDRAADLARANARIIPSDAGIVIVEGNYLLLDREPWRELKSLFDLTVQLRVEERVLERRLIKRWLDHGLDQSSAKIRAQANDIANARLIISASLPADIVIEEND